MTVPSEQSRIQYTTDGTSVSFPVPFRFLNASHLQVARQHNDESSILELGVDYSVSGVGNQAGGTITTTTTLPAGDSISIERVVPITQETAYQRNDPFPERAHEQALDKLTMICQMLGSVLGMTPGSIGRALLLGAADIDSEGAYRANRNRIQNLGKPLATTDAARKQDIIEALSNLATDGSGQYVIERLADDADPSNGSHMISKPGGGTVADLFRLNGSEYLPWRREKAAFADNVFMMLNASAVSVYEYADLVIGTSEDQSENDWAPAFQAAINRAEELGIGFVDAFGDFGLKSSVIIPSGITLRGQNRQSVITPHQSGTFTKGFCFLLNTDGDVPVIPFPNNLTSGVCGFYFNNKSQTPARRGVLFSGSSKVEDLKGRWMAQMVKSLGGSAYSDNSRIRGIHSEPVIGQEYQVELSGLGDGANISDLHFPRRSDAINGPQNGNPNGLKIRISMGFSVSCMVGGNILIQRAVGGMGGCHLEFSTITIEASMFAIRDTYICPHEVYAPIITNGDTGIRGHVTLDNVQFARMYGLSVRTEPDVLLDPTFGLSIRNSYRRHSSSSNVAQGTLTGIRVATRDGSLIPDFTHHSAQLSVGGDLLVGGRIKGKYSYHVSGTAEGISSVFDSLQAGSSTLNGTYYYNSQIALDPTRQILIDTAQAEKSITTTNGFVGLNVSPLTATPCSIRLYRGKAANSYTHTVDVPMIGSGVLVDDGNSVNGYAWNTITAAPMPPQISISIAEISGSFGGRAEIVSNSGTSPNRGTWKQGDLIRYGNAPSAGMLGAVCTVAGSPGTWKQYGRIDS